MCTLSSAGGKSRPVTGALQDMRADFVQDWIAACVLRDVAIGLLRCIVGCGCWFVTFVLQDVTSGMLLPVYCEMYPLACYYLCIAGCISGMLLPVYCGMYPLACYYLCTAGCIRWHATTFVLRDVSAGMLLRVYCGMYPLACYYLCIVGCSSWLAVYYYGVQPMAAKGLILVWCLATSLMQDL